MLDYAILLFTNCERYQCYRSQIVNDNNNTTHASTNQTLPQHSSKYIFFFRSKAFSQKRQYNTSDNSARLRNLFHEASKISTDNQCIQCDRNPNYTNENMVNDNIQYSPILLQPSIPIMANT